MYEGNRIKRYVRLRSARRKAYAAGDFQRMWYIDYAIGRLMYGD